MGYVFIRYAKPDQEFVDKISADLSQAGVRIWQGKQSIAPGQNWGDAIEAAITEADALIFVSSRFSSSSRLIAHDLEIAANHQVPVLPLPIDFLGFRNMPKSLYGIKWLDFRKDYPETLASLIERIPETARSNEPVSELAQQSRGYVFISYAEEDTPFVIELREFFKRHGYSYWDYQESERDYHNQLFVELEEVIREADATISVLSPDWRQSAWTPKEYLFSLQVETPVFLLHVRTMEPTLLIAGVPYIDFVREKSLGFEKLEAELKRKGLL